MTLGLPSPGVVSDVIREEKVEMLLTQAASSVEGLQVLRAQGKIMQETNEVYMCCTAPRPNSQTRNHRPQLFNPKPYVRKS